MNLTAKKSVFQQYKWLINNQHKTLEQWFQRGENYLPHARRVFVERGLPEDLAYLAFIESGYNPYAYSRARASGCWQFMSYTGRRFGLRYASWIDERRDPVRAAEAAASYLELLYGIFNDWSLAVASYNAGEGKIGRAVRLTGAKNFFELAERNGRLRGRARLARETLNYVPRFLAMVKIAKKHELLGFEPMDFNKAQDLLQVKAKGPVRLKRLAANLGLSWADFKLYNPSFRSTSIPARQHAYIYVPHAKAEALNVYLSGKKAVAGAETVTKHTRVAHRVRRGDTLSHLAQRYGSTVGKIKRANHLRSDLIRIGQRLVVPKEEIVVVAKVIKPLKEKDEQKKATKTEIAATKGGSNPSAEVSLKPGQLAAIAEAKQSPAAETTRPRKRDEQQQKVAVAPKAPLRLTKAAPVFDAPKASEKERMGNALLQGLLGSAREKRQAAARPGAPEQQTRAAALQTPADRLQKPTRRPVEEWYQMLAKANLTWGLPDAVASAKKNRHYQVPAARPDKNAQVGNKVAKPELVPAPGRQIAQDAAAREVRSRRRASSGLAVSEPESRHNGPVYGHSMRRKINKITYGTRTATAAQPVLHKTSDSDAGPDMLESLHSFGQQLKKGFVKFFSWESETHGAKARRDVAKAANPRSSRS